MDRRRSALIDTYLAAGDIARAAATAQQALAAGDVQPMYLNLAAWACEEAGDFSGARALLHRALALAPGDPAITTAIGTTFRKQGRFADAIEAIDATIDRTPDYVVAWLERGFTYEAAGSFASAAESFERVIALDPGMAPAHAGLAWIASIEGDAERVERHSAEAIRIEPGNMTAINAVARSEIERGLFASARTRLEASLARGDIEPAKRMIALGLLGNALDRLDDADAAFAAYTQAKAVFAVGATAPNPTAPTHRDFVADIDAAVERHYRALHLPDLSGERAPARAHVFVLGYPRSGTTLIENILASAPDVEALEETATLIDTELEFLLDPDRLEILFGLDAQATAARRSAYWHQVRAAGVDIAGRVFVDMDPLKSLKLPLIAKLFPDARVVLVRRDPRDVVWSCFRTMFASTSAAFEYVDLERAARHYDAVMRLTQTCLERLPLTVHVVRHEQLVADFDAVTQALCGFVDLPWSADLRRFDRTARHRGVSTASASQVRRGLYDGNGRWRRYAAQFDAIAPILTPWLDRFGYPS